jgi:hypothetical protein
MGGRSMDGEAGFLLAFLLPFHVGGGAAVGVALAKAIKEGPGLSALFSDGFLLLWGVVFGGMPLLFGREVEPHWFILLQLGLFLGTILFVMWRYKWLLELYSQPGMFVASFGFVFLLVGVAVMTVLAAQGDNEALPIALIFGGVGGIVTLAGVWMLLRPG